MRKFKLGFGSGDQENSKNLIPKNKQKGARKVFNLFNPKGQSTVGNVFIQRSMMEGLGRETDLHNSVSDRSWICGYARQLCKPDVGLKP